MTVRQRVGQLFIGAVPSTGVSSDDLRLLAGLDIGNVTLIERSSRGVADTARETQRIRASATQSRVSPFIATDQEGGEVQDLTGPGFSPMPTALDQGRLDPSALRHDARTWGSQLRRAGLNLDLAPVCDVVPARGARQNQPIGRYDREYGHSPHRVSTHVIAFARGMADAGMGATAKHFPGLGRASGNTDDSPHVTDPTTRHDRYLRPFRATIRDGVPVVMISTATYPNIDRKHKAVFSRTIITGMLRGDLNFRGVVISDSLTTPSVETMSAGERARRFIDAGGDIVLVTELSPLRDMVHAIRARMSDAKSFRHRVDAAVMSVLTTKARLGLLNR